MNGKGISGLALFLVLLLLGIGIFYYFRLMPKNTSVKNTSPVTKNTASASTVTGEILNIVEQENVITINTQDNEKIYIAPLPETKITNEEGKTVDSTYLKRGFTIKAIGEFNKKSAFFPTKISVVREPNIIVFSPLARQVIDTKFQVTGIARVFENVISLRIKHTATGKVYSQNTAQVHSKDTGEYGDFNFTYNLAALSSVLPSGDGLTLEVYQASAKDGSDQDLVSIPLIFQKNLKDGILSVQLFFSNSRLDTIASCSTVYPVERQIPKVQSVGRTALEELIKGPSASEKSKGYLTNIASGTKINKLVIEEGIAKVDFSRDIQSNLGDSCHAKAIKSQITETLLQFPTISSVEITVDGKKDEALQP